MPADENPPLVTFEARFEIDPPGTPAGPRPPHRPRSIPDTTLEEGVLVSFDAEFIPSPPGTPASPRPPGRPRELGDPLTTADEAFARELADRVREYARSRPSGLSAEQIAALIQQFLTRRAG